MSDASETDKKCRHEAVSFDYEASKCLSASEVRKRWPRFYGECECGFSGIAYESYLHYVAGNW